MISWKAPVGLGGLALLLLTFPSVAQAQTSVRQQASSASVCQAYAKGGNGAYSDCRPDRAQWVHHVILQCTDLEGGLYEKAGPWVGGYSTSTAYCNRSWDSRHRYWSEGHSEEP
jgi:hypothetical protein